MAPPELDDRVRGIVAAHLDVEPQRLAPGARLGEDLCVDSLTAVELLMVLEDEFDIALPEDRVGPIETYADLVSAVAAQVARTA
ncbi:MAG: acyl carrier protein [Acidimicrobiales bacterium]